MIVEFLGACAHKLLHDFGPVMETMRMQVR